MSFIVSPIINKEDEESNTSIITTSLPIENSSLDNSSFSESLSSSINQNNTINTYTPPTTRPKTDSQETIQSYLNNDSSLSKIKVSTYKSKISTGRNVASDPNYRLSDAGQNSDTDSDTSKSLKRNGAVTPPGFWLIDIDAPPRTPEQTALLAASEAEGRKRTNKEWKNNQTKKRMSPKGSRIYGSHVTK
ncbi:7331_t:CDS:1 [Ambispora gerdemannii]|uniref:7331_t:CDS:1 n=1 Tax=Ambispora gerdemannii TaxID=144530 RepID=A0A9N8VJ80_9GLOM|nr:7331_t:CDS:1 [Ambispora gerdemannii]